MRILSVDDHADNRYFVETLFRGNGHEVDSAANGREALALAAACRPDVILADILMPVMDGFQLCREAKRDPALRDVPFLFYTATYTDARDERLALSLGADRFLVKPLDGPQLVAEVEAAVARTGQSRPATAVAPPADETEYLAEYNARLIAKLEKKLIELEAVHDELRRDIAAREKAEAERARLESRLRQAQKLEAIGTLAGGIAHDFNNILGGIVGYADLVRHAAPDVATAREYADEILRASHRAGELIRQILAFSRQQEQSRQPIRLGRPVAEALKLMRASLPAEVALETAIDPDAPAVLADGTRIHQVVANLVTNAWHALRGKAGTIRVELAEAALGPAAAQSRPELRPGRYARLTVADDGCGMDAPTAERIFEPFFTTKDPGVGTGLGLATVHGIIRSWDGAVVVESEPGKGSRFHVYLPAIDLDEAAPAPGKAPIARGAGERVLWVDDEPALVQVGVKSLEQLGYRASGTTSAVEALEMWGKEAFDVAVTDLTMPGASGLDLARQMQIIRPGARVVLSTGFSPTLDDLRAAELGFAALLVKPHTLAELGQTLHRALHGPAEAP
jgi:signal transduction histidine kinase